MKILKNILYTLISIFIIFILSFALHNTNDFGVWYFGSGFAFCLFYFRNSLFKINEKNDFIHIVIWLNMSFLGMFIYPYLSLDFLSGGRLNKYYNKEHK